MEGGQYQLRLETYAPIPFGSPASAIRIFNNYKPYFKINF